MMLDWTQAWPGSLASACVASNYHDFGGSVASSHC